MVKRIRPATEAEILSIQANAWIDPSCEVIALDTPKGVQLAVRRFAVEIDPVHFSQEADNRTKVIFMRDIETRLDAQGVPRYFFNVDASDIKWLEAVKSWGAVQVSGEPELRFAKDL